MSHRVNKPRASDLPTSLSPISQVLFSSFFLLPTFAHTQGKIHPSIPAPSHHLHLHIPSETIICTLLLPLSTRQREKKTARRSQNTPRRVTRRPHSHVYTLQSLLTHAHLIATALNAPCFAAENARILPPSCFHTLMEAATRRSLLTLRVTYIWEPLLTRLAQITNIHAEIAAAMYDPRDLDHRLEIHRISRISGQKIVTYLPG